MKIQGLMVWLTKGLGLAPPPPKTGSREAATFVFLIAATLTIIVAAAAIYHNNPDFLAQGAIYVGSLWISALALFAHAFHLKSEQIEQASQQETPDPYSGGFQEPSYDPNNAGTL